MFCNRLSQEFQFPRIRDFLDERLLRICDNFSDWLAKR